jgi:hypothetical protein
MGGSRRRQEGGMLSGPPRRCQSSHGQLAPVREVRLIAVECEQGFVRLRVGQRVIRPLASGVGSRSSQIASGDQLIIGWSHRSRQRRPQGSLSTVVASTTSPSRRSVGVGAGGGTSGSAARSVSASPVGRFRVAAGQSTLTMLAAGAAPGGDESFASSRQHAADPTSAATDTAVTALDRSSLFHNPDWLTRHDGLAI